MATVGQSFATTSLDGNQFVLIPRLSCFIHGWLGLPFSIIYPSLRHAARCWLGGAHHFGRWLPNEQRFGVAMVADTLLRESNGSRHIIGMYIDVCSISSNIKFPSSDPYAPCMEYLPTFALEITQMYVNIPWRIWETYDNLHGEGTS